ncbi:putative DNA-binding protein (MmcQ/YjbR family) [Corynebacterium lowii]|nr:putative DNA-binding protein (MmcQ/YjbR family) [Corynebacterium lowii]
MFRCPSNGKWFGMLMDIPGGKIGLGGVSGAERTDILVLKNDPDVVALLLCKEGYVPAYHMNKEHWFSILLGDVVPGEEIRALIADSADMVCTRK